MFEAVEAGGVQLLHVRNPWVVKEGVPEWSGDWSDRSPLWADNADVAAACNFTVCVPSPSPTPHSPSLFPTEAGLHQ